ncbi:MAG: FAD-dependent oxidoreductase [Alphaproteobacteria bacterium]|nr:FAD-dependent oxidoreductase [Alphaproteobacteria bacterium]MBV9862774.1 FAD-dependent oxidoreductase [Alphaproteobacteria bacterium]
MLPHRVQCCIAGGGPAGVMLGFLLARAGVETAVLEKHKDFLRDFRGDTIHPSTLQVMHELGLLEAFLARPHQEVRELHGIIGEDDITLADFSRTPTRCHFIALMPQWHFLDFLTEQGRHYPGFRLEMEAEAIDLIEEGGRIVGVAGRAAGNGGFEIRADLVIGADGRHSVIRERAGLEVMTIGAPIDVLWMRLSKKSSDPPQTLGRINLGRMLVMLDRGDYWQCAYVIRKGGFDALRARGLDAFHADLVKIAPPLHDRVQELKSWEDIKLLTVTVDRLKRWWRPGLLCIGDAAHAMSPIGGVGINLAIQDAVATANLLAGRLRAGNASERDLAAVERRRTLPTRLTQAMQVMVQRRVLDRVLGSETPLKAPWFVKMFNQVPWLRGIPARVVGVGFRPEHVRSAAIS